MHSIGVEIMQKIISILLLMTILLAVPQTGMTATTSNELQKTSQSLREILETGFVIDHFSQGQLILRKKITNKHIWCTLAVTNDQAVTSCYKLN